MALKIKLTKVSVQQHNFGNRGGEPKKYYDKIYVWVDGETLGENLINRRDRPYDFYKKEVLPLLMKHLEKEYPGSLNDEVKNQKWSWSQHCGCSMCPCSPGFIGDGRNANDIHVTFKISEI